MPVMCAGRGAADLYFVKGQWWYKFLLRSLVTVQAGIYIPAWHQMCEKSHKQRCTKAFGQQEESYRISLQLACRALTLDLIAMSNALKRVGR